jgi:hypothetical protein
VPANEDHRRLHAGLRTASGREQYHRRLGGYHIGFYQNDIDDTNYLEFDGLTFRHGSDFYATAGSVHDISDEHGYITVHDVRFTDFTNGPGAALTPVSLFAVKGSIQLVDVQFDHLQQNDNSDKCSVRMWTSNDTTFKANFVTADLTGGRTLPGSQRTERHVHGDDRQQHHPGFRQRRA